MAPDPTAYDVLGFGETMLRFSPPDGGRIEDARTFESYVAGTESNTLAGASRLGLRCAWISALPENALGRRVVGELRRHGVDTRGVVWATDPARLGVFYAEEAPAPVGTRVHYDRAGSAISVLDSDAVDLTIIEAARVLHLTGITHALGPGAREVFQRLLQKARDTEVEVSFDVSTTGPNFGKHPRPPRASSRRAGRLRSSCARATTRPHCGALRVTRSRYCGRWKKGSAPGRPS